MKNKNLFNSLASSALISLVLVTSFNLSTVEAKSNKIQRTSGLNRYETAAQVATKNWTTSDNVVLVCGEGYADAISASVLAKKLDAPILLTSPKNLSGDAKNALETLKSKNIYIIGGTASISQNIRDYLNSKYKIIELGGSNRYETNIAVAKKLIELGVNPSNAIMVGGEGFSDALSVAPVASAKEQILLLGMNDINYINTTTKFIKDNNSNVTVVGTNYVINDSVYKAINAKTRIPGGSDRFDTNLKVLQAFDIDLKADKVFMANASGDGYADALVASAIAGKHAAPLVILDNEKANSTTMALNYLKSKSNNTTNIEVLGGTGVVSENVISKIEQTVDPTNNSNNNSSNIEINKIYGSSNGNTVNGSWALESGDYIYCLTDTDFEQSSIYRINKDGSNPTKIIGDGNLDCLSGLNIVNNTLYYTEYSNNNTNLFKVNTDGSSNAKLLENIESYIATENKIYYIDKADNYRLYKCNLDGSNKTAITTDAVTAFNLSGEYIVYTNGIVDTSMGFERLVPENIYKIKLDGNEKTLLLNTPGTCLNTVGSDIYYINSSDNYKIYKLSLDGKTNIKINDDSTETFNVKDGWIYYSNASDSVKISYNRSGGTLYKIKTDGSSRTKLNNNYSKYINVVENTIFYGNPFDSGNMGGVLRYKINTDGTNDISADVK